MNRNLAIFIAFLSVCGPLEAQEPQALPTSHTKRDIEGWTVHIDDRLLALELRIQTDVLNNNNRESAHLRLDHRREAVKLVEITGLELVLVKIPVHHDIEKESAEVISAGDEKQQHSGEHETLHLTWGIGNQPTENGDGGNRTQWANNDKA